MRKGRSRGKTAARRVTASRVVARCRADSRRASEFARCRPTRLRNGPIAGAQPGVAIRRFARRDSLRQRPARPTSRPPGPQCEREVMKRRIRAATSSGCSSTSMWLPPLISRTSRSGKPSASAAVPSVVDTMLSAPRSTSVGVGIFARSGRRSPGSQVAYVAGSNFMRQPPSASRKPSATNERNRSSGMLG